MGLEAVLHKVPPLLAARYRKALPEIRRFQVSGHELREQCRQNPVRHGHLLTREMHPVELDIAKHLCRDLSARDPKVRQRAWYWVLKQDWGRDLRASPYEQRYFWNEPVAAAK